MTTTPTQNTVNKAVVAFLTGVLPPGTPIIQGQVNRTPEPKEPDYVVFWMIGHERLSQNIDNYDDAVFTGSIAGTVLDITAADSAFTGKLGVGIYIFGVNVTPGTKITALGTGTGGIGTYTVSPSQTVGSETITGGTANLEQKVRITIQCDVHGPNGSDNAFAISIAMWDAIADRFFNSAVTGVSPLYSDDPKQMPFLNGEQQYENRWSVDIHVQTNQTVFFSQQFASAVDVDVINVSATYPVS